MATMSRYCKAYPTSEFRKYEKWSEKTGSFGIDLETKASEMVDSELGIRNESCLFLHDNLVVTGDVFSDANIVFDDVTAAWRQFCQTELKFEIPESTLPEKIETIERTAASAASA